MLGLQGFMAGGSMDHPALSLLVSLEKWLEYRSRSWSHGTEANHRAMARSWANNIGSDILLKSINRINIQQLYLQEDNGTRSGSYLNEERRALRSFFTWAMDMGILEESPVTRASWPVLDPEKKRSSRSRVPVRVTRGILEQILDLALLRYHRLFAFLFLVGTRIGETLALRWRSVEEDPRDPLQWILRVPGPSRKTRHECVVILSPAVRKILGKRGQPDERVFVEAPTSRDTVRSALERIGRKLGIPHLGSHQFRRSLATSLLNAGLPLPALQQQMGWRSPPREVLELLRQSYYLGSDTEQVRRITDSLWDK